MATINHLKNLSNKRNVRAVLSASGQIVTVYEPTIDEINKIIEMQERWLNKDKFVMTGEDLVKIIVPMLTDIDGIENATDEEIKEIVENPSILYMQIQYEIEIIIKEIYQALVLANRRALADQDLEVTMYHSTQEMFDKVLMNATKLTGNENLRENVIELANKLEEKVGREEQKALDVAEESTKSNLDRYQDMLNKYERAFADKSNTKVMENDNVND